MNNPATVTDIFSGKAVLGVKLILQLFKAKESLILVIFGV
jgi:hypothetical protein